MELSSEVLELSIEVMEKLSIEVMELNIGVMELSIGSCSLVGILVFGWRGGNLSYWVYGCKGQRILSQVQEFVVSDFPTTFRDLAVQIENLRKSYQCCG
jgi:hypothetical protein